MEFGVKSDPSDLITAPGLASFFLVSALVPRLIKAGAFSKEEAVEIVEQALRHQESFAATWQQSQSLAEARGLLDTMLSALTSSEAPD